MVEQPERKRIPKYFSSPTIEEAEEMVGRERHLQLAGTIIKQLFFNPSLSFSRQCWGDFLWKLYHSNEPRDEGGYDNLDIMLNISLLQEWLTTFGLVRGEEIERIRRGERIQAVDPRPKYATWEEMLDLGSRWKREGKVIGGVHGGFDPTQVGHARLMSNVWPYCDVLVVGFDSNALLRKRKGKDRPRFPQLAWRMWEIASLWSVDHCFVLPFDQVDPQAYEKMYEQLDIKVLGAGKDNPLIPEYQERMARRGGFLLIDPRYPWSSTRMVGDLTDEEIAQHLVLSVPLLQAEADRMDLIARQAGFLRDYPENTRKVS